MVSDEMSHPKVFISYSHDSAEHADRVLALSDRLRADGIDCILDQYEDSPAEGWPRWMDRQIRAADFVLMICTATYYRRVMGEEEPGKGHGVAWESTLIYQYIYNAGTSNTRFIPVLLKGAHASAIPIPWQGVKQYRPATTEGYEELYRRLTGQRLTPKPALGTLRMMPPRQRKKDFIGDMSNEHPTHPVTSVSSAAGATAEGSVQVPMTQKAKDEEFDVFLCHNSHDKPQVKEIARQLQARGLKPWLDEWQLRPGLPWQRALEAQIEQIKSAAVFVGKNGRGPWQDMELEAFIREFVSRNCPVIPVVLADAPDKPQLPIFLRGMTWVDFRKQNPDPMRQLIWGIEGKNPNVIHSEASGPKDGSSGAPIAKPTPVSISKISGNPSQLTFQQKSELVNKLLACATMRDGNSRNLVVQELSFAGSISRHTGDRVDVMNIVNTSLNYQDGLQKLVEVISPFENDASGNESLPMKQLRAFVNSLS
jgi:nucleotide-binding universal stress UspA family protein